jgi:hypothetical protein
MSANSMPSGSTVSAHLQAGQQRAQPASGVRRRCTAGSRAAPRTSSSSEAVSSVIVSRRAGARPSQRDEERAKAGTTQCQRSMVWESISAPLPAAAAAARGRADA